jgi:polysaccharide export outer membrane protein
MNAPKTAVRPEKYSRAGSLFSCVAFALAALLMTGGCESTATTPPAETATTPAEPTAAPMDTSATPAETTPTEAAPMEVAAAPAEVPAAPVAPVSPPPAAPSYRKPTEVYTIRESDVLKISFPETPSLDTTQQVRRDGRITLTMAGEIEVTGMTPEALEKELLARYESQLVSKEVTVTVVSTSFFIYVSGSVQRPGKIASDRPITALEAIMESGGFGPRANSAAVKVIRQENGMANNYTINLRQGLEGKSTEVFYLKPSDIIVVPEKFTWF